MENNAKEAYRPVPGVDDKLPHQDDVERVILRRLYERRIDGFTLEMAKEISAIFQKTAKAPAWQPSISEAKAWDDYRGIVFDAWEKRQGK